MSYWWIFPPPGIGSHGKLDNSQYNGSYSKRQPLSFSYQVGDEVLVMVSEMTKITKEARESVGGHSDTDIRALPNFAMITKTDNSTNNNTSTSSSSRKSKHWSTILMGRVKQVKTVEVDAAAAAANNNETNARNTNSIVLSKTVVFVDVVFPPSSSNCSHNSVVSTMTTNSLLFNDLEQRRWLQPHFVMARDDDKSRVAVVLVQETAPFRRLIDFQLYQSHLGHKDRVLEIGCSTGKLSQRIWKMDVDAWVGIDNSAEMINTCSRQLDRCNIGTRSRFNVLKVDPMLEPQRAYTETMKILGGFPTVICLDIGGNRELRAVMEVLSWVFRMFVESNSLDSTDDKLRQPPRLLLVKSRALVRSLLQDGANGNVRIDYSTGMISYGYDWLKTTFQHGWPKPEGNRDDDEPHYKLTVKRISHPAKAPMAYSPIDGKTPICRYHNYHPQGCKRRDYAPSPCQFDHWHCHACRKPGHIALDCTEDCVCY
jgi:SAM-dependent methyltransferase